MNRERGGRDPIFFSCLNSSLRNAFACSWPVERARNQVVRPRELLDPVFAATARSTSVSSACEAISKFDSDTVHHHLRKLSSGDSLSYLQRVNREVLVEARKLGLLGGRQVVAIDTHKDPDWTHDHDDCIRARGQRGTGFVLDYLSIETVDGPRLTLSFAPVTNEHRLREQYERVLDEALHESLVGMLLGDRGFYSKRLILALQARRVPYVIAAPRNSVIKRRIRNARSRAKRIPKTRCFFAETSVTFQSRGERSTTNVVLFWRPDERTGRLVCFPFATSESNLSPERAYELAYLYLKRWNIETGYRIKNKLRVRTCSPHAGVRRFLQYFAIIVHNLWTLVRWSKRQRKPESTFTLRAFQVMLDTLVTTGAQ